MQFKESDRLRTRLFAINLRVAELDQEVHQTRLRVQRLESQLENANLARLMGEEAGNPAEIGPELERFRGSLADQREVLDRVKKSQWKARVEYTLVRAKERRDERAEDGSSGAGEREAE